MKKIILLVIASFLFSHYAKAQGELFIHSNIELILNDKIYFNYNKPELEPTKSFGFTTSLDYLLFKKLSIGLATGYKKYKRPDDFQMIELGGIVRYFVIDTDYPSVFISMTEELSLNKEIFLNGFNARIGIVFPILKQEKLNVNFTIFKEMNELNLGKSKPYTIDTYMQYRAAGFSLGIKF